MIKLEHVVLASPEQMKFIIEGMRNPRNSWGRGKCMLGNKKPCVHTLCPDWESKYIYPVRETWAKEEK